MSGEVQSQAKKLGLIDLPRYTFYAQPKKIKVMFSKFKPDSAYLVENWMKNLDSTTTISEFMMGGRSSGYYYLAPQINVYVEIVDKISGYFAYSEDNHVNKIDIYTNNEDYVKAIVKSINDIWDDGILAHLNIKKIEKKFKVKGEDIINAWNSFL
ncbi:unnamed protein product [marine sediment metagenome]|uniref:Uncharacterized protein n=1 Tax=marine sediment metagenome TaxID=412755 RepID=X1JV53_9ZZZZ